LGKKKRKTIIPFEEEEEEEEAGSSIDSLLPADDESRVPRRRAPIAQLIPLPRETMAAANHHRHLQTETTKKVHAFFNQSLPSHIITLLVRFGKKYRLEKIDK
jgi:hypothetical protein